MWHLAGKAALAAWAWTQPDVVEVRNEVWLPNRERRCDVRVLFADGSQVALEAQSSRLTDPAWAARHHDYRHTGVVDEWLWHPDHPTPWMLLTDTEHPQQIWLLNPWRDSLTLLVGAPHPYPNSAAAPVHRVEHLPPCVRDDLIPYEFPLSQMTLTRDGIDIPAHVRHQLADQLEQERRRLQTVHDATHQTRSQASAPARPPTVPDTADGPLGRIIASWPAIRAHTRQISGAAVHALLAGASVSQLEGDTLILTHEHTPLAQRLATPQHTDAVRTAIRQVLGRDYQIQWKGSPMPKHMHMHTTMPQRRFDIQASHVEDFDTVFDLLREAGAQYTGHEREFTIDQTTFTTEQVWALIQLAQHPEQPRITPSWHPDQQP